MSGALFGLAVGAINLMWGLVVKPWRHLDTDEHIGGFPVGPLMYMGLFAVIASIPMLLVCGSFVLIGWPDLWRSSWEGVL